MNKFLLLIPIILSLTLVVVFTEQYADGSHNQITLKSDKSLYHKGEIIHLTGNITKVVPGENFVTLGFYPANSQYGYFQVKIQFDNGTFSYDHVSGSPDYQWIERDGKSVGSVYIDVMYNGTFAMVLPQYQEVPSVICDVNYPDFCIPQYPPDLDCGDFTQKSFTALPPDPHRLDRDGDGYACGSAPK